METIKCIGKTIRADEGSILIPPMDLRTTEDLEEFIVAVRRAGVIMSAMRIVKWASDGEENRHDCKCGGCGGCGKGFERE